MRAHRITETALALLSLFLTTALGAGEPGKASPAELHALRLRSGSRLELRDFRSRAGLEFPVTLPDGTEGVLDLEPSSARSRRLRVFRSESARSLVEMPSAADARTYRGDFRVGSDVFGKAAASVLPEGVYARILLDDGRSFAIQPVPGGAAGESHVIFDGADVVEPSPASCAAKSAMRQSPATGDDGGEPSTAEAGTAEAGTVKVATLAADADWEYYQIYGSVAAVESRIESLLNLINVQYERDVGIRFELGSLVVRTSSNDPYSSSDPSTLLDQLRSHWNANHGGTSRDLVHLFTGRELDNNVIGIAFLGVVCNQSYGYGLSQADFSSNIESTTDLIAHEIGHNFDADHCSCPSYTMNPTVTSANQFHPTSTIPVIEAFRDSVGCLADVESVDSTPPAVVIQDPDDGDAVAGMLSISASASDDSGIASVAFYLDGAGSPFATDATAPYGATLDTSGAADGEHTLTAVAVDASTSANSASHAIQIFIINSAVADPGFAFIDVDNDGVFSALAGDGGVPLEWLLDGAYDTRKPEDGTSPVPGAGLVIPASLGTLSPAAGGGLSFAADGHLRLDAPIAVLDDGASIVLSSRDGDVAVGLVATDADITLSAPGKVLITAASGQAAADGFQISGAAVRVKGGSVALAGGSIQGSSSVQVISTSGVLGLEDVTLEAEPLSGKLVVKGGGGLEAEASTFSALKIAVQSKLDLEAPSCTFLACGSSTGALACSGKGSVDLGGASLVAGKKTAVAALQADLTGATVASSDAVGSVALKGESINVQGATVLSGAAAPKVSGALSGTPALMGVGTVACP
jgi:hypothetical protein